MRKLQQRHNDSRRGATAVELAFVLPIFFAVVLGVVEFGRAMMVSQLVTNGAREGARLAILDGSTNSEVEGIIKDFIEDSVDVSSQEVSVSITVTPAPGNEDPGNEVGNAQPRDLVEIVVAVPFDSVSYIPGDYLNGTTLTGKSAMRHE